MTSSRIKPNVNGLKNPGQNNKMVQAGSASPNFFHTPTPAYTHDKPLALNNDNRLESVENANRAVTDTGKQLVELKLDKSCLFEDSSLRPDINRLIAQNRAQPGSPSTNSHKSISISGERSKELSAAKLKLLEGIKHKHRLDAQEPLDEGIYMMADTAPSKKPTLTSFNNKWQANSSRCPSGISELPPIFKINTPPSLNAPAPDANKPIEKIKEKVFFKI